MTAPQDAKTLVDEIRKTKYKFSVWEVKFMDTVDMLIKYNRNLSDKRSKALQQIYRRAMGG